MIRALLSVLLVLALALPGMALRAASADASGGFVSVTLCSGATARIALDGPAAPARDHFDCFEHCLAVAAAPPAAPAAAGPSAPALRLAAPVAHPLQPGPHPAPGRARSPPILS